jgi:predicted ribosome-associated RNA-binding protein Tma20
LFSPGDRAVSRLQPENRLVNDTVNKGLIKKKFGNKIYDDITRTKENNIENKNNLTYKLRHTSEKFTVLHLDVEVLRVEMVQPYITIVTTAQKVVDIKWKNTGH